MTGHAPVVLETMHSDCLDSACEHQDPSDCPLTPMVCCEACSDNTDADDWMPVTEWPCGEVRGGPMDQQTKAQLLAQYQAQQETT